MINKDNIYSAKIFLNAAIPLVKVISEHTDLGKGFAGKNGIVQISVNTPENKWGTHFIIKDGKLQTRLGCSKTKPTVELEFKDLASFNNFFKGKSKKLPKIRGITKLGLLIPTFKVLLKMASLLGASQPPEDEDTKELLVRLYFYLLSSGISQLNKAGHPEISNWAQKSPDRVYAWSVDNYPDIAAYLRVKAGNSKSARGAYTRSQPFFTMRFNNLDAALAILLGTGDMVEMIANNQMIMDGAPEFGAQIGDYMLLVGDYAK